jgi:hypothetical protein
VCRRGTPCTEPAGGIRLSFVRNNTTVAFPLIAKDGRYTLALPAGTYYVNFENRDRTAGVGRLVPDIVRVIAGRTRTVDFLIDTGLR